MACLVRVRSLDEARPTKTRQTHNPGLRRGERMWYRLR